MDEQALRDKIINAFRDQGFKYNPHVRPPDSDKNTLKELQLKSKIEQIQLHKSFIIDNTKNIKEYLRNGKDINPSKISLELREVRPRSLEEILFRWWNFTWWSVPYQRGYGRFLRFMLWDKVHDAPFGLISLQSPILKMSVRDKYLDIPSNDLDFWINQSMQAQRLGALPPYNELLGGKMTALAITSNEVRESYINKYTNKSTLLKQRSLSPRLLFITTTSAFGQSSIYNRLYYTDNDIVPEITKGYSRKPIQLVAQSLGYTQGSGSFHIPESLYLEMIDFLKYRGYEASRNWGNGPSRKLRLIEKACSLLGLKNGAYHNIKREFFLFPLVNNLAGVIKQQEDPRYYNRPFQDINDFWLKRWCIPRSERSTKWQEFDKNIYISKVLSQIEINGQRQARE